MIVNLIPRCPSSFQNTMTARAGEEQEQEELKEQEQEEEDEEVPAANPLPQSLR